MHSIKKNSKVRKNLQENFDNVDPLVLMFISSIKCNKNQESDIVIFSDNTPPPPLFQLPAKFSN